MMTRKNIARAFVSAIIISISLWLWTRGLLQSPVMDPLVLKEKAFVKQYIQDNSPDYGAVKLLAEAYWERYPDVERDSYYGRKGPMGIFGPKEHFEQHGKREGRLYTFLVKDQIPEKKKQ